MTLIALIAIAAAALAYLVINPEAIRSGHALQIAVVGGLALVVAVIPITIAHLSLVGHLPLGIAIGGPIGAYLIGGVAGATAAFADLLLHHPHSAPPPAAIARMDAARSSERQLR